MFLFSLLCAAKAVPLQLTQQGRLLDSAQAPISGLHQLEIRLYNDPFAGTLLWQESLSVDFVNGYYSVILGGDTLNNPIDQSVLKQHPLYLALEIDEEGELSPRQGIYSTPYAQLSGTAVAVDGGPVNASQVEIAGSVVIDASGAWVGPTIALNWSELQGIPADILDGDDVLSEADVLSAVTSQTIDLAQGSKVGGADIVTVSTDRDTLLGLSCVDGNVAKYDASMGWYCDFDSVLSEQEVQAAVASAPLTLAEGTTIQGTTLLSEVSCQEGEVLTYQAGVWTCKNMMQMLDADSDGVLAWGDCDDEDASLGSTSQDSDCDGVLTADDCDDSDGSDALFSGDCDQDGVSTVDDCDDEDILLGATAQDSDCDGVLTVEDCDDNNSLVSSSTGTNAACAASSCLEILNNGSSIGNGSYFLKAQDGSTYQSFCEMSIDGGGWSLVIKAWNGDTQNFYNSESHSTFEDSSTIASSSLNLNPADHKSLAYVEVQGEQLLAIDLNDHAHYVHGELSNGAQTALQHILDAQDGRWEGGANGCGIMLDNLFLSQGSSTVVGSIPVEHFGLMCTDDEQSNGWSNRSDDSVYVGFLPRAAHGDQTRNHHSGIGKWANDGGDDVYESSNQEYSSSSGIAILIR